MLKWAAIFLVLMLVAGILAFAMKIAVFVTKLLFFTCLAGFAISAIAGLLKKGGFR